MMRRTISMPFSSSPCIAAVRQTTGPGSRPLTTRTGVTVETPSNNWLADQVRRGEVPAACCRPVIRALSPAIFRLWRRRFVSQGNRARNGHGRMLAAGEGWGWRLSAATGVGVGLRPAPLRFSRDSGALMRPGVARRVLQRLRGRRRLAGRQRQQERQGAGRH